MDDAEIPEIPGKIKHKIAHPNALVLVNITNALEKQVADAFLLFDNNQNKTIDPAEIGTVMRALGCFPNTDEVQEMLEECEDNHMPGLIHLAKFLPWMCRRLTEHRYQPASPAQLLEAFRIIDLEGKGFITKECMAELMTTYGEKFSQDEIDEMLEVAVDRLTQTVPYEYYLNKIMYVPTVNLYDLADVVEASKPRPADKKKQRQKSMMFDDMD